MGGTNWPALLIDLQDEYRDFPEHLSRNSELTFCIAFILFISFIVTLIKELRRLSLSTCISCTLLNHITLLYIVLNNLNIARLKTQSISVISTESIEHQNTQAPCRFEGIWIASLVNNFTYHKAIKEPQSLIRDLPYVLHIPIIKERPHILKGSTKT